MPEQFLGLVAGFATGGVFMAMLILRQARRTLRDTYQV